MGSSLFMYHILQVAEEKLGIFLYNDNDKRLYFKQETNFNYK